MQNIVNPSKQVLLKAFGAFVLGMLFAVAPVQQALAYQIPADAANTWTVVGSTASKSTPSGVRVNIAITGAPLVFQLLNNTSCLAGSGTASGAGVCPAPGAFVNPNLPTATNGLQLLATTDTCQTSNPGTLNCNTLGTLTVTFTDAAGLPIPVRNPIMHLSRVAGNFTDVNGNIVLGFGVTHTLTSAGATIGAPLPGFDSLAVAGNVISPVVSLNSTAQCTNGTGGAGCGSIPFTGTVSTLAFNIGAVRSATNVAWNNVAGAGDAWYVSFSFDEDFGDAPNSYQGAVGAVGTAPASHIQSDLTLGSAWTAANNNTTVLNGTSAGAANYSASPVQVAAGADNNNANGDGAEENGLAMPLASITTNQIGTTYTLTPTLSGASRAGTVCGWIDFNRDGAFTAAEGTCSAFAAGATSAALNWTIPTATTAGRAYVRIRASYAAMTTSSFNGLLNSGEVEDYNLEIKPAVRVVKALAPAGDPGTFNLSIAGTNFATGVGDGGTTGFKSVYQATTTANDVTVGTNVANAAVTGVILTETGAGATVLTNYTTTSACTNAAGTVVTVGGTALAPSITIPQSVTGAGANGQAQTITCTLTNLHKPTLTVTKTASASPLVVGQTGQSYTITIAVTNGPTTAAITLADALPAGITTSGAITATGGTLSGCPAAGATNLTGCSIAAGAANGNIVITVPVSVAATAANPSTNNATATGGGDPACTGTAPACTGTVTTPVILSANVAITKTDSKSLSSSGSTNAYVVSLSNQGPSAANGVIVTDVVGAGLTCPGANAVTCTVTAGAAVCPAGPLTIANLTGAGITVATLPSGGTLQFAYACTVN